MNIQTSHVRRRSFSRAILASLLGFTLAVGGIELAFRFLLFSPSSVARKLGAGLRKAELFSDPRSEEEFWRLQDLFLDPAHRQGAVRPDPVCGWTGPILPDTYEPAQPSDLRGRRPVLLYGDSYARCLTPAGQCFQTLLERSDLADRCCLVNYGVGGYGIDQELLLLQHSIDRWKDLDPIVVVSFLVDDALARNRFAFRCWPKPRLKIEGDRLVPEGPVLTDPEEFREANPIRIRSYLWRFLVFREGVLPARVQARLRRAFAHHAEEAVLGVKILEEFHRELESRGLRHFFLVFHGWDALQPVPRARWAEDLVVETAARLGVPGGHTRPFLLAAADGDAALAQARLFLPPDWGHYNEIGNLAAFEALRQGIEGRFSGVDTSRAAGLLTQAPWGDARPRTEARLFGCAAWIRAQGRSGFARFGKAAYPPFPPDAQEGYLVLGPGDGDRTEVQLAVPQRPCRFLSKAISVSRGRAAAHPDPLILSVRIDGRTLRREEVPLFPDGIDLDIPLDGARELELVVERTGPSAGDAWIHVAGARLEWVP
jgi:hypothetical protein